MDVRVYIYCVVVVDNSTLDSQGDSLDLNIKGLNVSWSCWVLRVLWLFLARLLQVSGTNYVELNRLKNRLLYLLSALYRDAGVLI